MTRPTRSILDPTRPYTPAVETDLKKTFARIRRELKQAEELRLASAAKVQPMRKKEKA